MAKPKRIPRKPQGYRFGTDADDAGYVGGGNPFAIDVFPNSHKWIAGMFAVGIFVAYKQSKTGKYAGGRTKRWGS